MGNGKCPFQCWVFSVLCSAANTALGWICVLVFKSWGGVCVHKELGGCLVAEKDLIRDMGIEPGAEGRQVLARSGVGDFASSFPCVEWAAKEGQGSLAKFQCL